MNEDDGIPRRRLTRAEAKARTRQQVLDAAARVFAQKGYAGASVEEIAESAGYSIGALYSNFASKERLFLELMSARPAAASPRSPRSSGTGTPGIPSRRSPGSWNEPPTTTGTPT